MPLDPSIALGVRPIEIPNQLAQYAQMAQVENAQQQNALAQFQLGAARRAEQGQTALGQAYGEFYGGGAGMGGVPGAAPGEISYDAMSNSIVNKLSKTAPHLIPGELAKIAEMKQKALLTKETQGKIDAQAAAQIDKSLSVFRQAVPAINDADSAVRYIKAQYADPVLGKVAVRFKPLEQTIEETIQRFSTPEGIRQWKIENAGITGDKLIDMMRQTTQTTDLGGQVRERKMDYFGNPVGEPTFTQKTPTVGDVTGQQRLAFDKAKFAWEKANPNKTIHEDANGLLAIDNRTGVATPVVYGSTGIQPAPIAAPGASMMRQPPPAASTNQRIPAIPGMTSVLDQTGAPLVAQDSERMPGMPVAGKGQNLTESQGNATAFGLRMKEANSILENLAKKGTLRGANIESTPFIGESLGKILPSVLGGTSAVQQQVNQAKSNFITAVLRKESGATILDSEFDREDKKYFPQVNDSDAVIKQKDTARKLAIKAMEYQAGPGAKNIQKYQPSGGIPGANANDPLGLGFGGR